MLENLVVEARPPAVNWPLRLAQQTFASVLDRRQHAGSFAAASRRQGARHALSELSMDDRGSLERWLALQLITITADSHRDALAALCSIDALLAAAVGVQLARADAELIRPTRRWHAVQYPPAGKSSTAQNHGLSSPRIQTSAVRLHDAEKTGIAHSQKCLLVALPD